MWWIVYHLEYVRVILSKVCLEKLLQRWIYPLSSLKLENKMFKSSVLKKMT